MKWVPCCLYAQVNVFRLLVVMNEEDCLLSDLEGALCPPDGMLGF